MQAEIVLTQADKEALLSERELREYQIYMRLRQPPMAQSTQLQFFQLFLNHTSCEEIHRLNPNGFSLGAIVRARIENDWDIKAREHRDAMMNKIREKVGQITLETVDRIANEIAASNKLTNDRVQKFLQTGDVAELKDTGVGSLRHLQASIDLLQKLTGASAPQKPQQVEVRHTVAQEVPNEKVIPVIPAGKPVEPQTAAAALAAIHKSRQK